MFDRLVASRSRSSRSTVLVVVSAVLHAAVATTLVIAGMWQIDKLSLPERRVLYLAAPSIEVPPEPEREAPRTPPKAAATGGGTTRKARPTSMVSSETGDPDVEISLSGRDDASGSGTDGTGADGHGFGRDLGPGLDSHMPLDRVTPPPPAPKPRNVPAQMLEGSRIAGNASIMPPDSVRASMVRAGQDSVRADIRMCLDTAGAVRSLEVLSSTGYEAYDSELVHEMRQWQYRPYRMGEDAIPVCTVITFVYRMQ